MMMMEWVGTVRKSVRVIYRYRSGLLDRVPLSAGDDDGRGIVMTEMVKLKTDFILVLMKVTVMMFRNRRYSYTWVRSRLEWEEYTAAANAAGIGRHEPDDDDDGDDGDDDGDNNEDEEEMES